MILTGEQIGAGTINVSKIQLGMKIVPVLTPTSSPTTMAIKGYVWYLANPETIPTFTTRPNVRIQLRRTDGTLVKEWVVQADQSPSWKPWPPDGKYNYMNIDLTVTNFLNVTQDENVYLNVFVDDAAYVTPTPYTGTQFTIYYDLDTTLTAQLSATEIAIGSTVTVTGSLTTQLGDIVTNAPIIVMANGAAVSQVVTNDNGEYAVDLIFQSQGSYAITVSYAGGTI